jgi:hypothetical protein
MLVFSVIVTGIRYSPPSPAGLPARDRSALPISPFQPESLWNDKCVLHLGATHSYCKEAGMMGKPGE